MNRLGVRCQACCADRALPAPLHMLVHLASRLKLLRRACALARALCKQVEHSQGTPALARAPCKQVKHSQGAPVHLHAPLTSRLKLPRHTCALACALCKQVKHSQGAPMHLHAPLTSRLKLPRRTRPQRPAGHLLSPRPPRLPSRCCLPSPHSRSGRCSRRHHSRRRHA